MKKITGKILTLMVGAMFSLAANASGYPSKPISLVIPYAPGGLTDNLGRLYADQLSALWGQAVVVENKPGAGGSIGAGNVARAGADGYSLLLGSVGMVTNPMLFKSLPYEQSALAPVALIAVAPNVLYVHPGVPAKSVGELVDYAKKESRKLTFASSGVGSSPHLAAELFAARTGLEIIHVPYKGTGPAMIDFLGGRVDAYFDTMQSMHYAKAGKLRALAVTTEARIGTEPDLPTVQESGVAPGVISSSWFGFFMPANTPADIQQKVVEGLRSIAAKPEINTKTANLGLIPDFRDAAQFKKFVDTETTKWGDVIRTQKISIE